MPKTLLSIPDGITRLEVDTDPLGRRHFILPARMSEAARIAFLCSPRLEPILAHLQEDGGEGAEGLVVFALHKLAMDLMARYPALDPQASPALEAPTLPIAHLVIRQCEPARFVFCTSYKDLAICREEQLGTLQEVLVNALRLLPQEARAIEVRYEGIVAGTYPRPVLEQLPEHIARTAVRTKEAVEEAAGFGQLLSWEALFHPASAGGPPA